MEKGLGLKGDRRQRDQRLKTRYNRFGNGEDHSGDQPDRAHPVPRRHDALSRASLPPEQAKHRCRDNRVRRELRNPRRRRSLARARPRWPSMPRVAAPAAAAAASPRLKGGRLGEGSGAGTVAMLGLRRLL